MKTVNLLPQWYLDRQRQRRHMNMHLALMVVVGVVLAGWALTQQRELATLKAQRSDLVRQAAGLRDLTPDLQRNDLELKRLHNLQVAARELGNTVPMSAVVQQILNNMTPGMALSHVAIDVHSDPFKMDGRIASDPRHPPRFHDVAHISVSGVAPDPMLIGQLIGRLSTNGLFSDVALNFSRAELLHDYDVRRFDILLNLDLDRVNGQMPDETTDAGSGGADHAG